MTKNPNTEAINICKAPSSQESEEAKSATEPVSIASLGGIIAAFFASLCCIGPVLFAALGVGMGTTGILASTAGFLKAFVPYRPFFIIVAVAAIGTGFYLVYRKPKAACPSESNCPDPRTYSKPAVFLWVATAITLLFVLSPYWLGVLQ